MSHLTKEESRKRVWRVCGVLAIVTAIEITAALSHYKWFHESPKMGLNMLYIALSALKAYFIMSEFMHLKYELKAMAVTILAPFLFLIWGIIAFLWEGHYWLDSKELWNILN
ncbi:MAG: cytochrome C oxidase subunit IV family protein [Chitinophagales bacterium]